MSILLIWALYQVILMTVLYIIYIHTIIRNLGCGLFKRLNLIGLSFSLRKKSNNSELRKNSIKSPITEFPLWPELVLNWFPCSTSVIWTKRVQPMSRDMGSSSKPTTKASESKGILNAESREQNVGLYGIFLEANTACRVMTNGLKVRKIWAENECSSTLIFRFRQWASRWPLSMPGAYRAVTGPGKQRNAL